MIHTLHELCMHILGRWCMFFSYVALQMGTNNVQCVRLWLTQPVVRWCRLASVGSPRTCHRVDAYIPRLIHVGIDYCNMSLADDTGSIHAWHNLCHMTDALRPLQILLIHAQSPHLTMNERYSQDTTDAGNPRQISTKQCSQTTTNAGDPRPMSLVRCCFLLADIYCPKHRGLGWWCVSLHNADIAQLMCACHNLCVQA